MSTPAQLLRTPLHPRTAALCLPGNWRRWAGHLAAGSYDLVLDREYWAIRNAAALIDVSPLMKYRITGADATRLLDRMTPRDMNRLQLQQACYTPWCDEDGKMLDDGTIQRRGEQDYLLTSAEPSLRWLHMNAFGMSVEIEDISLQLATLSLQGPRSRAILNLLCEQSVDGLRYFRLMTNRIGGIELTISRTGYTGDLGYEIWIEAARALEVWDALLEAGRDHGIAPCGILAMDIARVEAGLIMLDVDYTPANFAWNEAQKSSPLELGLGWSVHLDKPGYFVGRAALEREDAQGSAWQLRGVEVDWEGMERLFARHGLSPQLPAMAVRGSVPLYAGRKQAGYASTSTWSPVLKKYIALVHLERPWFEAGTELEIEITVEHHRCRAPARVVNLPFYEPAWKKT